MDTEKGTRSSYLWKLKQSCPGCTKDMTIYNFFYGIKGQLRAYFLCVTCAKRLYYDYNAFDLAHQAQDLDNYESFMTAPEVTTETQGES